MTAAPVIHWHPYAPVGIAVARSAKGPAAVTVYVREARGSVTVLPTDTLWLATESERRRFVDRVVLGADEQQSLLTAEDQGALLVLLDEAAQVGAVVVPGEETQPAARARVVTLSDVQVEPVRWLWPGRIPYGKLTVLEGDPGLGKSQLALALAAAVSTGSALPGGMTSDAGEPGHVLLLTGEDGLADTVRPRVEAAGGDPGRIHSFESVPDPERPGQYRFPSLPEDVSHLLLEIRARGVTLVIVDTLTTYLGGEFNSFKDADVRRALAPLAHLAETTGCAIVLIRHLTKQSRGRAITAGGGSIGIVGGARSCLLLAEDPDNPELRVLAVVKANLTKKPDSLSLTIEEAANGWPHVVWSGTSSHSADDLIAARGEEGEDKSALDDAREHLRGWLASGPVLQQEIERLARDAGISDKTLRRAKAKERVQSQRTGFGKSPWFWCLPATSESTETHYTRPHGHLSTSDAVTPCAPTPHLDGQGGWPSKAGEAMAMYADRPHCSLHSGVPFRKRRRGCTGCWVCMPNDPKNPYVEPLPGPGDLEYEKYRTGVAA